MMPTLHPTRAALVLLLTAAVGTAAAATPSEMMFADAVAKERAVRIAFAGEEAPAAVLKAVHAVVADFQTLVRRHPASAYADDALWHAGRLALEAFEKYGETRDRETGERLLHLLVSEYPTSRWAKRAPDLLAAPVKRVDRPAPAPSAESPTARREAASPLPAEAPSGIRPPPAAGAPAGRTETALRRIQRVVLPDVVRVIIELDQEVPFHDERIENPARVFVDLAPARPIAALVDKTLRFEGDSDPVRQVRIGRHPNSTTRVVLDAANVSSYSVYPLYQPFRLVIDCVRSGVQVQLTHAVPSAKPRTVPKLIPPPPPVLGSTPVGTGRIYLNAPAPSVAAAFFEEPQPPAPLPAKAIGEPTARAAQIVSPPARNLAGGFSLSRQLGLRVSRVVIDPGHGGHDPGAKGQGLTEAEVVLDVALRLEKLLEKEPGMEVVLTRRTDDFVPLEERTAIANREGADLFLSIHGNASPNPQAHGVETFYLNFANTLSASAVAARENAASGQAMGALPDLVKSIALNNKLDESRDFATLVQHSMIDKLGGTNKLLKDLGVKQAPFVVLIGAAMPSVLAEISFLTNTQEVRLLRSGAYRQRIAEALFASIRNYQKALKSVGTIAQQP